MSAKSLSQPAAERCACGQLPGLHKIQAGREFVYYVSCGHCQIETEKTDRLEDAIAEWNEGLTLPPILTGANEGNREARRA